MSKLRDEVAAARAAWVAAEAKAAEAAAEAAEAWAVAEAWAATAKAVEAEAAKNVRQRIALLQSAQGGRNE